MSVTTNYFTPHTSIGAISTSRRRGFMDASTAVCYWFWIMSNWLRFVCRVTFKTRPSLSHSSVDLYTRARGLASGRDIPAWQQSSWPYCHFAMHCIYEMAVASRCTAMESEMLLREFCPFVCYLLALCWNLPADLQEAYILPFLIPYPRRGGRFFPTHIPHSAYCPPHI